MQAWFDIELIGPPSIEHKIWVWNFQILAVINPFENMLITI